MYYCPQQEHKVNTAKRLPVRWMSPESITRRIYSYASDVWAYGIVLWEIYSLGKVPYFGHSNEKVISLIIDGVQLEPPAGSPEYIAGIMKSCWNPEPNRRISFKDICSSLATKNSGHSSPAQPANQKSIEHKFPAESEEAINDHHSGYLQPIMHRNGIVYSELSIRSSSEEIFE
ncbi:unnamed protein product [Notodromas monacha]|uniref:Protein kinase domain-containing protein n=1 Tax=Notodromas monacha TaxID=399045 RepID=A0A7R9BHY4_9CRUS|nr:unnamed protein product [Notodromas monacha]CAG0915831.1 unnamed protein product [Notodromas monacha]